MKHFKISEFESPDLKGSGVFMDQCFLEMIDNARTLANFPFIINSGYRTKEHNINIYKRLKKPVNKNTSHLKGLAADIKCNDRRSRFVIINALRSVGFTRIGIASTFIHCDTDKNKIQNLMWTYLKK